MINLTIPNVHYEVSKSILESKKHSYSEKPLSIEFDDGKKLNDVSMNNNRFVRIPEICGKSRGFGGEYFGNSGDNESSRTESVRRFSFLPPSISI